MRTIRQEEESSGLNLLQKGGASENAETTLSSCRCNLCEERIERDALQCQCGSHFHVQCLAERWLPADPCPASSGNPNKDTCCEGSIPSEGSCPHCGHLNTWFSLLQTIKNAGWGGRGRRGRRVVKVVQPEQSGEKRHGRIKARKGKKSELCLIEEEGHTAGLHACVKRGKKPGGSKPSTSSSCPVLNPNDETALPLIDSSCSLDPVAEDPKAITISDYEVDEPLKDNLKERLAAVLQHAPQTTDGSSALEADQYDYDVTLLVKRGSQNPQHETWLQVYERTPAPDLTLTASPLPLAERLKQRLSMKSLCCGAGEIDKGARAVVDSGVGAVESRQGAGTPMHIERAASSDDDVCDLVTSSSSDSEHCPTGSHRTSEHCLTESHRTSEHCLTESQLNKGAVKHCGGSSQQALSAAGVTLHLVALAISSSAENSPASGLGSSDKGTKLTQLEAPTSPGYREYSCSTGKKSCLCDFPTAAKKLMNFIDSIDSVAGVQKSGEIEGSPSRVNVTSREHCILRSTSLQEGVKKRGRTTTASSVEAASFEARGSGEERAVAHGTNTLSCSNNHPVQTPSSYSFPAVGPDVLPIEIMDTVTPLPLRRRCEEGEGCTLGSRAVEYLYPCLEHEVIELLHED
ncbi:hypothetical protein CEUSTIGMA_g12420.t1 [Chlamydomonas eustigma]|uniref:Uncharacterized protein n=1 Tax=Chlamydomonas eustigma TaxID=1157962 RepID=A0A250XPX7_9CHLO|nr:hypothetical protein CEUSTIGMA_g12420.t1 [Chlamydomonas eustigma]|eukprot:GAX84999.1 hypothetical protein CEUSTIGMA_g12420.t1 [Chlamydomonas eustigma]